MATAIFRGPPWAARPAQLIFAGWIPQDELFGWSVSPCLKDERDNESRCCSQLTRKCSKRCHAPDRRPAVFGEMGG